MIETLATYLRFPFVQYALVAGTLTALCASLLGVPLVLRRFSYIGDGLSHVAFGAMAFAAVFGLADRMTIVLPATDVCAILLLYGGRDGNPHAHQGRSDRDRHAERRRRDDVRAVL